MAFTISIAITGDEKDYTAAVQRAQQATNQLKTSAQGAGIIFDQYGKTISSAAQQAERGLQSNAAAANNTTIAYGKFRPAVALAASQVAGLGPVSHVASSALIALTAGTLGTGLALGGLALALGLAIPKIQQYREEAEKARQSGVFGLGEGRDPHAFQRSLVEMQQALVLALDTERARGDAGKQIGLQLDAQAQKLIQQFPANEQFIKNTVERLKNEKNITIEIERRLKLSAEENDSANRLAEIQKRIGAGIRQTKAEDEEARRKAIDEENESALRLAEIQGRVGAGRRATVAEDNAKLVESFALQKGLAEVEADRLEVLGLSNQAQAVRQQGIIQELESQRTLNVELGKNTDLLDAQINLAQTRLSRVGAITLDIGQAVFGALGDMATGMAQGTLKGVGILKVAGAAALRVGTDFLQQFIRNKLSFETTLLTNMRGLAPQMQQAFASGGGFAAMASALDAQHGGGGISLGGGGGALSTGSGQGGFLSNIMGLFGGGGNFATAALTGLGLGSVGSAFGGGINSQIFSMAGSLGFSALNSVLGLSSSIGLNALAAPLVGMLNEMLPTMLAMTTQGFLNFAIPGIGSLIGVLLSFLMKPAAPFTKIQARVKTPFKYDALTEEFIAATFGAKATASVGISGSSNKQISGAVVAALTQQAELWTGVLNLFPEFVHDRMIPTLAAANATLRRFLRKEFKFSPGGSQSIEDELKLFAEKVAPRILFYSLRGTIGQGLAGLFGPAGFGGLESAALAQFAPVRGSGADNQFAGIAGLKAPGKKNMEAFRSALMEFIGIGTSLAQISPAGVTPFLTAEDMTGTEAALRKVLAVRKGKDFAPAVDAFKQQTGPVLEFLQQAVQQSQQLMGRGITAAFEAATESAAVQNFMRTLGGGVQDAILNGATQAFLASAQFNDLLAPVQQIIRQFTQEAIATGQKPDIAAFQAALLPRIEDFTMRADLLKELVAAFNKFGIDIKSALGGLTGFRAGPIQISVSGSDPEAVARYLADFLRPQISPN